MNWFDAQRQKTQVTKQRYPAGTRIEINNMDDPYAPIQSGTRGTVDFVDDIGTVHIKWDDGRALGIIPGEDSFRKLSPEEVEAESLAQKQEIGDKKESTQVETPNPKLSM